MNGEELAMLQKAADIIRDEFGDLSAESITAFLYILSQGQLTIMQLSSVLSMRPGDATRLVMELSEHSGIGLVKVDLDGDINRTITITERGFIFGDRLGYILRS